MADASKVLDQARGLIEERLKELNEERKRLEHALSNLGGKRRGPGRPPGSGRKAASASPTGGTRRRRRRGGTRAEQTLKQLKENPGMSASEIAAKLKIKPNYMYRVMAELQKDGLVEKKGRQYYAK